MGENVAALSSTKFSTIHTDFRIISADKLVFSADNRIASIASDWVVGGINQVYLWDKFGEAPVQPIKRTELSSTSFSSNGLEIDLGTVNFTDEGFSSPTVLSPDSNYELAPDAQYNYELINKNNGSIIHNFSKWAIGAFSPNSDLAVVFGEDNPYGHPTWIEIWDVKNGKKLWSMVLSTGIPRYVQFSPDGTLLVTISTDQTVLLWGVNE